MNTSNELKDIYSQRFNTNPPLCYIDNIDNVEFVITEQEYKVPPRYIKVFKSLKATARYFNCDRSKIKTRIRDNKPLDGWMLSYTDYSPNTQ